MAGVTRSRHLVAGELCRRYEVFRWGGLEAVLDAGPAAAGYADQCWTLARVADQAWRRFVGVAGQPQD
jgi:hypothetical protein